MPWLEAAFPARMARIALVGPAESLRDLLVSVAGLGTVEIDRPATEAAGPGDTGRPGQTWPPPGPGQDAPQGHARAAAGHAAAGPALSAVPRDIRDLERAGRHDLIAGEAQLASYAAAAVSGSGAAALAGWTPADRVAELSARLSGLGCAVVPLPRPPGAEVPSLVTGSPARRALSPLVSTYGTVPYADINPAWLAWASYVLMFGIMFGDAGDGLLLIAAAVALRVGWPARARRFRAAWPFAAGAGVAATGFGLAYGEFFGPTGLVPVLWLDPLSSPIPLLLAGIGLGAIFLAGAYALGTINRWREGGWPLALYAPSGLAGSVLFLGLGAAAGGWYYHYSGLLIAGGLTGVIAVALAFAGFIAEAGGGGYAIAQASVEVFDLVIRLGSNVASFARLAAFGLAHAALGLLVWQGTTALWHRGGLMAYFAVVVFGTGTALAFGLEALVAAVQALRLEYYELFSRVFVAQGRLFRPWQLRVEASAPDAAALG